MGLDRLEDLLPQIVLLEQMQEAENRCLIRDFFGAGETPHGGSLNQRILHCWTTEALPLLHQVHSEHCAQWI